MGDIFQHLDYINPQVNLTSGSPAAIQCINGISNPGVIGALLHFKPSIQGGILYLSSLTPPLLYPSLDASN